MVAQVYNLSVWELGAGESKVQGQPQLCSKFEDSIGCIRHVLKVKANVEERPIKEVHGIVDSRDAQRGGWD